MKICLVGLDNLPALARQYKHHMVGGESVQQTLLARALARRGHDVSMVVADYGQIDGLECEGIRVYKAYHMQAGMPVLRFVHPRWTGLWAALRRADADIYYTSCAGMQVGLMALYCHFHNKRFVFRCASDTDCDKSRLLVKYARDRWLYSWGLRRADAVLVQSAVQEDILRRSFGLPGRIAGMLVENPLTTPQRDIDVLWVGNIRGLKRPDRLLELAAKLPHVNFHMVGGPLRGDAALYEQIKTAANSMTNVTFHGPLSYWDANDMYGRAKLLVNTSDIEGFPNSYLQAWIRGVPVVTLIDPDRVIERERLGAAARAPEELAGIIGGLLADPAAWQVTSDGCRRFMAHEFGEDKILSPYLDTFDKALHSGPASLRVIPSRAS